MKFTFDNSFYRFSQELYSNTTPTKVKSPQLVFFNEKLAEELDISDYDNKENTGNILSGNCIAEHSNPIALAYSGHQFGHFAQLGDGRAILLGEQITNSGKRFDIQLKGSGTTPYSRNGDGRATLSSMLRELIYSEAIHHLKIPTSRTLAVVATGEAVYRDKINEGGILTRVAQSHIRIGTFQHTQQHTSQQNISKLLTYTIQRHYPEIKDSSNPAIAFIKAVAHKQIALVIEWMRVGFVHGVLNSDNVLVSGETIDYGPCAFLNSYTPNKSFSSIDHYGRYAFNKQAPALLWNLARLAESLLKEIDPIEKVAINTAQEALADFQSRYQKGYMKMMGQKLGFNNIKNEDFDLIKDLLTWMEKHKADYTNTFLHLMDNTKINDKIYTEPSFLTWKTKWKEELRKEDTTASEQQQLMSSMNPKYIPRNYLVEEALVQICEKDNPAPLNMLIEKISQPYHESWDLDFTQSPSQDFDLNYKTFCGT